VQVESLQDRIVDLHSGVSFLLVHWAGAFLSAVCCLLVCLSAVCCLLVCLSGVWYLLSVLWCLLCNGPTQWSVFFLAALGRCLSVCCLLSAVCLSDVCCLVSFVCCLLSAVYFSACPLVWMFACLLSAVCCLQSAICCLVFSICYILSSCCCLLFACLLSTVCPLIYFCDTSLSHRLPACDGHMVLVTYSILTLCAHFVHTTACRPSNIVAHFVHTTRC
jgi:hypothetical protein